MAPESGYSVGVACLAALIALIAPRIAILLLAIFSRFMHEAYDTVVWPILGFFLLPYTTLAYALAINQAGSVEGLYLVLVIIAVFVDLGALSGGGYSRQTVAVRRH